MRLSQLVAALPSLDSRPDADPDITLVTDDSRRVMPGALFVAYRGVSVDGHRFVPDAIARGATAIVGELPWTWTNTDDTASKDNPRLSAFTPHLQTPQVGAGVRVPYLRVRSGREAFAWLHAAWNDFPARRLVTIGVTGTDGKTTTVNLIYSILKAAGVRVGMISTVNAVIGDEVLDTGLHVTTPDADDLQRYLRRMVDAGLTHCVLEVTSHGLEQHRADACEFDVAVVTNITHEHLDLHGSLDAYRAAKARLFDSLATAHDKGIPKTAVLNVDDSSFEYLHPRVSGCLYGYGMIHRRNTDSTPSPVQRGRAGVGGAASLRYYGANDVAYAPDATRFTLIGEDRAVPFETPLVGEHNVYNCLAALGATVGALSVDPEAGRRGVAALRGIPGRMERIAAGQDFIALVDFAHTPNALEKAITAARTMTQGQVIVAFGSAGLRDREKRRLMGAAAGRLADKIVITAEDPRTESLDAIMDVMARAVAAQGKIEGVDFWRVLDRGEAIAFACSLAQPGDVVMACGKGHEQSMCFGETEYPWDDREAMRAALRGSSLQVLPTARMKNAE
jgi:UDP-N-acetylmuramoyl-L-alanyl-D-glutamate--2,6-diaminopimelate ligase